MYQLLIKILGEKDFKKYTIEEIEEMKKILEQFKATEEVRLTKMKQEVINNGQEEVRKSF